MQLLPSPFPNIKLIIILRTRCPYERQSIQASVLSLCQSVALLRLHVGRHADKNADCKKLLDEADKDEEVIVLKNHYEDVIKLQKLRSGIIEGKDDDDKTQNARNSLKAIVESLCPKSDSETQEVSSQCIELLVDVGRTATHMSFDDVGSEVIELCKNTKAIGSPRFRVKLDYLKCELQAKVRIAGRRECVVCFFSFFRRRLLTSHEPQN